MKGQFALDVLRSLRKVNYVQGTDKNKVTYIKPLFSLAVNYYISARLRLNLNYRIDYLYSNTDTKYAFNEECIYLKTNTFHNYYNAGFIYSFF